MKKIEKDERITILHSHSGHEIFVFYPQFIETMNVSRGCLSVSTNNIFIHNPLTISNIPLVRYYTNIYR